MVDELINSGDCGATAMLPYNIYSYSAYRYSTIQAHNVDPHQLKIALFTSYINFIMNQARLFRFYESQTVATDSCHRLWQLIHVTEIMSFANRKDLNQLPQSVTVCPYCLQIQFNSSTCSRQTTIFWNKGGCAGSVK